MKDYNTQDLNKIKYSVRASQAILQGGVGAMIDFQEQTLMTAAPETWSDYAYIHDERLEKVLNVTHFRGFDSTRKRPTVSYIRFPNWYFCPRCKEFKSVEQWKKSATRKQIEDDPYMIKKLWCPKCRVPLVVSSIVTVCENGHIDEFPWIKWVHARSKRKVCDATSLTIQNSSGNTGGIESTFIRCKCGAGASLQGAFSKTIFDDIENKSNGIYDFRCAGFHPWKNVHEKCTCYPVTAQKGSSMVYYPYILSSLVIPPYSSKATQKVDDSRHFETFLGEINRNIERLRKKGRDENTIKIELEEIINEYAEDISKETGLDEEIVNGILVRKVGGNSEAEEESAVKYRYEEYTALNGSIVIEDCNTGDFLREETNIKDYLLPFVKQIVLINKLREVRVLKGFTRVDPIDRDIDNKNSRRIVDIRPEGENWYPAYDVRGEGIFIEFDNDAIKHWIKRFPEVTKRAVTVNEKFHESYFGRNSQKTITAKYMMLHTLAHLLIKEVSFSCGYNIASLQERIYCSEEHTDGVDMQGILIYTAGGDSEGTLGGLVRQGRHDLFPGIFRRAVESAMYCSNDPVCSLSTGQGRNGLNLASCHTCTLIPETSCEDGNIFLDRGMIIGTFDKRDKGFFSDMVYSDNKWNYTSVTNNASPTESVLKSIIDRAEIHIIDKGLSLDDSVTYKEIWRGLLVDADEAEVETLKKLIEIDLDEKMIEKPHENARFMIGKSEYECELIWENHKVMYFSQCSKKEFEAVKKSDWHCFYGADPDFDFEEFIKAIGG